MNASMLDSNVLPSPKTFAGPYMWPQNRSFVKQTLFLSSFLACFLVDQAGSDAFDEETGWGHLTGTIQIITGSHTNLAKIVPKDGSLNVDGKTNGLENVVIYLESKGKSIPSHSSYFNSNTKSVHLEMKDFEFLPRILLMRTDQKMLQSSMDENAYNLNIALFNNAPM